MRNCARGLESLKDFSVMERAVELRQTAGRISGKGRHFEIAHAVALMAAPGMYEAVLDATHELLAAR